MNEHTIKLVGTIKEVREIHIKASEFPTCEPKPLGPLTVSRKAGAGIKIGPSTLPLISIFGKYEMTKEVILIVHKMNNEWNILILPDVKKKVIKTE